jgi:hypothetical protein
VLPPPWADGSWVVRGSQRGVERRGPRADHGERLVEHSIAHANVHLFSGRVERRRADRFHLKAHSGSLTFKNRR